MKYRFQEGLDTGKIVRIRIDPALSRKELMEAEADLRAAERSLSEGNVKWAIIQGYYAMFHSLRSRIFEKGYREKSHRCLRYAIEALLVDEGLLDRKVLEDFSSAMDLREGADYGSIYDEKSARSLIDAARRTLAGQ